MSRDLKDHRIYNYLNEPVRFMGLTIDEMVLLLTGIGLAIYVVGIPFKVIFLIVGIGGTYFLKQIKKLILGFSLTGFCHWHLGVRNRLYRDWPHSSKKVWLS